MAAASDPAAADANFPADAIEVARILDAWGVKGWIRVQPYAKDPQALFSSRRWFLRPPISQPGRPGPLIQSLYLLPGEADRPRREALLEKIIATFGNQEQPMLDLARFGNDTSDVALTARLAKLALERKFGNRVRFDLVHVECLLNAGRARETILLVDALYKQAERDQWVAETRMAFDALRTIAYFGLLIVVIIAALAQMGVNPASLLAVLGAAGLAIALALKDSLSNFASGVMLILLRPFKAGDYVQIAGLEGTIEQVRVFQTQMRTIDNRVIVLPNSQITTAPIVNFTGRPTRRLDLVVGVGYDDDLSAARSALLDVASANERVLKDPSADVLVSALGESSVQLTLRAWVATSDVLAAKSELLEGIHRELRQRGLSIPFPQRDLHVYHHGTPPSGLPKAVHDALDDGDR